jgi:citrate synthase
MVASSKANLFASVASGVCALWGPLHGGANQAVLEMLEHIHREGDDGSHFIEAAKDKKSGRRLLLASDPPRWRALAKLASIVGLVMMGRLMAHSSVFSSIMIYDRCNAHLRRRQR